MEKFLLQSLPMNISTWMTICLVLATASIIAVAVYLVFTLIQLKKTAREMEETFARINKELGMINKVSSKVADITERISAPLVSAGTVIYYLFSAFTGKKKSGYKEEKHV